MTECYKLLFDLSLYWTISGYFLLAAAKTPPSVPAFLALAVAIGLDSIFRSRGIYDRQLRALRFLPLLLPLLMLLWKPALAQTLHALPVWVYLFWCMLSGRTEITYDRFRGHFGFGLRLLLLMVLGPFFTPSIGEPIVRAIPTLLLMLFTGVCLLRMLRERKPSGLRQGLYLAAFVSICAALTAGKAPQLLLKAFAYLYRGVLAPLIFVAAIAFAGLFYGLYLLLAWLVARAQGSREPLRFELQETAEMLGLEDQYTAYAVNLGWLRTLLIVLASAALLYFLWRVFHRLAGDRAATAAASPWHSQASEKANTAAVLRSASLLRPRAPRLAVRYYYARFLAECRKRSVSISKGMTATELAAHCAAAFPGADPAALASLYLPVRYSEQTPVTQAQAQRAAELWKTLKRSELPVKNRKK